MIMYFKYFFLFSKLSHYYIYYFFNFFYLLNFNFSFLSKLKYIIFNYCNILFFLLKILKNMFLFNMMKTLPLSTLMLNTQISTMYSSKSFQNIHLKNMLNKNYKNMKLNYNSMYDLLFLFNDNFMLMNKKINLYNFNNLILTLKLNYFLLLMNSKWHLMLSLTSTFSSISPLLIAVSSMSGSSQYAMYSPFFLWKFWNNLFFLIVNISFYNVSMLSFSSIYFKKLVDSFNWLTWSLSFFFWKNLNKSFFCKYLTKSKESLDFFKAFKTWFFGLTLVLDSNFHFSLLQIFNSFNMFNFALLDVNHEPWLSWYPMPCSSSDITLQYLFLMLFFKMSFLGLNLFFFFKFYYLYILSLLNFFYYFNNLMTNLLIM